MRPVAALLLLLAACGGPDADPVVVPTPLDPATLGSVKGLVRFAGTPPANPRLPLGGNAECAAHHSGGAVSDAVLVRGGLVQNALVSVKRGLEGRIFAWPKDPVRMANAKCIYVPRVIGAMTHQPVEFVNEDAADHNIHGLAAQGDFNFTLHGKGTSRSIKARRPEAPFRVKCDLHPWMLGWVGVFGHPYFRVTAPDGAFELPGLPAGTYELEAWHEVFGTRSATVTVEAGKTIEAVFEFRP